MITVDRVIHNGIDLMRWSLGAGVGGLQGAGGQRGTDRSGDAVLGRAVRASRREALACGTPVAGFARGAPWLLI